MKIPNRNDETHGQMNAPRSNHRESDLKQTFRLCKSAFIAVGLITCLLNILYLTGSIYMLEVYDRVLPSRSGPTLLGLTLIVIVVYIFQGFIDIIRQRLLLRIGLIIDENLRKRVFKIVLKLPLLQPVAGDPTGPIHDVDRVRGFIGGQGLGTLFDLPWIPFYLAICFLFHPLIGWTATVGAIVLLALAIYSEWRAKELGKSAHQENSERFELASMAIRNAEAAAAMGMQNALLRNYERVNSRGMETYRNTGDVIGGISAVSKVTRIALQSLVLAVGAYLVINDLTSAGVIIASSILTSRALAPVEAAIANWRQFIAARASLERLDGLLRTVPEDRPRLALPPPVRSLELLGVAVGPPGSKRLSVADISFEIEAGAGLGIIGPSASGKSSLVRAIVGAWPLSRGNVRLDGASIDQWNADELGPHIGYLPQHVELFGGSIAQNICRFDPNPDAAAVLKAAEIADVHQMILNMPDGYETQVGPNGMNLSAGQRQRVALARALYRDPFLVVLDEPNSNLDSAGERALIGAIRSVRLRGGIVIVVAHHSGALAAIDHILLLSQGRMMGLGRKDEIFKAISNQGGNGMNATRKVPTVPGPGSRTSLAAPAQQARPQNQPAPPNEPAEGEAQ